jgi:DNA-binding NarL/FixJ family response regulator
MEGLTTTSDQIRTDTAAHLISLRTSDSLRHFSSSSRADAQEDLPEYVLLLDPRSLQSECLSRSLSEYDEDLKVITATSIEDWQRKRMRYEPALILYMIGGKHVSDPDVSDKIAKLTQKFPLVPVVVGAEGDEIQQVLKALECGAKGYIPANIGIGVAAEAIALARAGGVFVPASSLLAAKEMITSSTTAAKCGDHSFTPREMSVADALRRGKSNKIIAYEMNLCESTVKVHIRNIMKKLHATNRTEVAYKIREFAQ